MAPHTVFIDVPATSRDGSADIIVFEKSGALPQGQVRSRVPLRDLGNYRRLRLKHFTKVDHTTGGYTAIASVSAYFILRIGFGNESLGSNGVSSLRTYGASTSATENLLSTDLTLPSTQLSAHASHCEFDVPSNSGYITITLGTPPGMTTDHALKSLGLWFEGIE